MSFLGDWHKQQKALKDVERDRKRNASIILRNYRGGEHSIKEVEQQKALKEAERDKKNNASNLLHTYRGGEHDIKDHERVTIEERKQNNARENTEHHITDVLADTKRGTVEIHAGMSRQLLSVDFSFGLIYQDYEPEPGIDSCALAASVIIPYVLSQWSSETKVFCDPKTPEIIGEISTDDWYDSEDSIRYVVKGQVPVFLFVESSEKETIAPLLKVLKRHVSFRPISATVVERATKENRSQFIIGEEGTSQWMRVREGRLGGSGIIF